MKIKILIATCFFIMAFFVTNTSIAQHIIPKTTEVEIYQGQMYETELTVYTNGYRIVERSCWSSNPSVVAVTEVNYYSLSNNIFGWILRFMGAAPMEVGIAVITATVVFEDEYGMGSTIFASSTIRVIIRSPIGSQQVSSIVNNIMIGDAIKKDN